MARAAAVEGAADRDAAAAPALARSSARGAAADDHDDYSALAGLVVSRALARRRGHATFYRLSVDAFVGVFFNLSASRRILKTSQRTFQGSGLTVGITRISRTNFRRRVPSNEVRDRYHAETVSLYCLFFRF